MNLPPSAHISIPQIITRKAVANTYDYRPLSAKDAEIRLLVLLPNHDSTNFNCYLRHQSLNDRPEYEALSYTWGNAAAIRPIAVAGKIFQVTKNLKEALQCLVLPNKSRTLWIDAICINQANVSERNEQVQLMAKIFQTAMRVIVWLGLGDEDTKAAFQRIAKEEAYKLKLTQGLELMRMSSPSLAHDIFSNPSDTIESKAEPLENDGGDFDESWPILRRPTDGLSEPSEDELRGMHKIFQHPWWERVWIIQEAGVAKELLVLCGRISIAWSSLSNIHFQDSKHTDRLRLPVRDDIIEPLRRINEVRRSWRESGFELQDDPLHQSLLRFMSRFRSSKATDPRDKIYAFLGVSKETSLKADYSLSTSQTYVNFTKAFVTGKWVNPLDYFEYCLPPGEQRGLPTWVPDWTVASTGDLEDWDLPSIGLNENSAAGIENRAVGSIQHQQEPYTLRLQGFRADRIEELGDNIRCSKAILLPLFKAYDIAHQILNPPEVPKGAVADMLQWLSESTAEIRKVIDKPHDQLVQPFYQLLDMDHPSSEPMYHEALKALRLLLTALVQGNLSRTAFTTQRGFFGLGRDDVREKDLICILYGGRYPFVLREEGDHYLFVGQCYCEGFMTGQAMLELKEGKHKLQDFVLH